MLTFSLQSGSCGNAIYVEAGDTRLLFDAGISAKRIAERLAQHGRNAADCDALIISHEHSDHVSGVGPVHRKFNIPVYATDRTMRAARAKVGKLHRVHRFERGTSFTIGDATIHAIPTPHDAADGSCFIVEHDGKRLGIFTDLGHPFAALADALASVDAAYLESNYDDDMLWNGPYPQFLKQRIDGDNGHLSNNDAAGFNARHGQRLQWLALAHLSEHNNAPEIALDTHRRVIGKSLHCVACSRTCVGDVLEVA